MDEVLILATSKPNKRSVVWIGRGKIESKLSETNYNVSVTRRREKSQNYYVNLLKMYVKMVEKNQCFDPVASLLSSREVSRPR